MALKILGIVPARGGSKGLPGKNLKPLGGTPLIVHAIRTAQSSGCLDRVIVSTDDSVIARIAKEAGGEVPWMRPPELATDTALVEDVLAHALHRLQQEGYSSDAVMLLQPTSPFRTVQTIQEAARLYRQHSGESVISVSPARDHPYWCKRIAADGTLEPWDKNVEGPKRRQELPAAYALNGVIYVASASLVLETRSLYSPRPKALLISESEAVDIDTPEDWVLAECLWRMRHSDK
jgi:N-acylneuraminate cytidylyltransferase/CMP-N,N'-diacetyllegionaminic acid synthase